MVRRYSFLSARLCRCSHGCRAAGPPNQPRPSSSCAGAARPGASLAALWGPVLGASPTQNRAVCRLPTGFSRPELPPGGGAVTRPLAAIPGTVLTTQGRPRQRNQPPSPLGPGIHGDTSHHRCESRFKAPGPRQTPLVSRSADAGAGAPVRCPQSHMSRAGRRGGGGAPPCATWGAAESEGLLAALLPRRRLPSCHLSPRNTGLGAPTRPQARLPSRGRGTPGEARWHLGPHGSRPPAAFARRAPTPWRVTDDVEPAALEAR